MNQTTHEIYNLLITLEKGLELIICNDGSPRLPKGYKGRSLSEGEISLLHDAISSIGDDDAVVDIRDDAIAVLNDKPKVGELLYVHATCEGDEAVASVRELCTEWDIPSDVGETAYRALENNTLDEAIKLVRNTQPESVAADTEILGERIDEHVIQSIRTVFYSGNRVNLEERPTGMAAVDHGDLDTLCSLIEEIGDVKAPLRAAEMKIHPDFEVIERMGLDPTKSHKTIRNKVRRLMAIEWFNTGYYPPSHGDRHQLHRYLSIALLNVVRPGSEYYQYACTVMYALRGLAAMGGYVTESEGVDFAKRKSMLDAGTRLGLAVKVILDSGVLPSTVVFNRYTRGAVDFVTAASVLMKCKDRLSSIRDNAIHYDDDGKYVEGSQFGATGIVHNNGSTTVHTGKFVGETDPDLFDDGGDEYTETNGGDRSFTSLFRVRNEQTCTE